MRYREFVIDSLYHSDLIHFRSHMQSLPSLCSQIALRDELASNGMVENGEAGHRKQKPGID